MKLFNKIFICKDEAELESNYRYYCNDAINKQLRIENEYLKERNEDLYFKNDQLKKEVEWLKNNQKVNIQVVDLKELLGE